MPSTVNSASTLVATFAMAVAASSSSLLYIVYRLLLSSDQPSVSPARWLVVTCAPFTITFYAVARGSLNRTGAVAAIPIGLALSLAHAGFFGALLAFFMGSSKVTKFRWREKAKLEGDSGEGNKGGGNRNWMQVRSAFNNASTDRHLLQVLCNGGVAFQLSLLYLLDVGSADLPLDFKANYRASWIIAAVLGSLSCCAGDTWASEIGSVYKRDSNPRLITTWRSVPPGTNGAVSLVGLLASALGGASVGVAFCTATWLVASASVLARAPYLGQTVILCTSAGFVGSLVDSVLGATVQYSGRRQNGVIVERPEPGAEHICGLALLDNHGVNLLSSIIMACVTPRMAMALTLP